MKVVKLAQTGYCGWAYGKCLLCRLRKICVICNFRKEAAKVWPLSGHLRRCSQTGTCTTSTDLHIVHHDVWQYWSNTHREPWHMTVLMCTPCTMTCGSIDVHTVHRDVWQYWCCTRRAPWRMTILMLYTPCTLTSGSTCVVHTVHRNV